MSDKTSPLKDHEIREFVNRLTNLANTYAGCDCMRAAISDEVMRVLRPPK